MPEHPAGTRGHRLQHERVTRPVNRRGDPELQDQFARAGEAVDLEETGIVIQGASAEIVGRHQQPHAPAPGQVAQALQGMSQSQAPVAPALAAPIQRQPAEPPARPIPRLWMNNVEAKHRLRR